MIVINISNTGEHMDNAIKWCREHIMANNWETRSLPQNDVIGYSKMITDEHIIYYLLPWFNEKYKADLFLCSFGFKNTEDSIMFKLRWG